MKYIIILVLLLSSCTDVIERDIVEKYPFAKLIDESLKLHIHQFIAMNKLDSSKHYIYLRTYGIGTREVVVLSFRNGIHPIMNNPYALAKQEGFVVVLDSGLSNYLSSIPTDSLARILKQEGVNIVDKEEDMIGRPDTWKLLRCENESFLVASSPISLSVAEDYIPCGLKYDTYKKEIVPQEYE